MSSLSRMGKASPEAHDNMRNNAMTMARMVWFAGVVIAAVLPVVGAKGQDAACTAKPGDEAAIIETVRGMYAAAMVDDRAKMRSYLAPGFYMFDGGKRYEGDSIMDVIEDYYKKGIRYVWSVTKPDVHVYCNEAWIAYINEGSITKPGAAPMPLQWLESAVLERQGGVWKIVFFHSTRVPAPAPLPVPTPAPTK
jgi:hypothetical protein